MSVIEHRVTKAEVSGSGGKGVQITGAADDVLLDPDNGSGVADGERGDWIYRALRKNLALCIECAPCGVVIHRNRLGKVLYVNRAAFELSGYTIAETSTGRMAGELFAPDPGERQRLRKDVRDAALKGKSSVFNITCKGGRVKTVELRVTRLSKSMTVSMWTDVTRREQAEQALRESKRELEDRVRERTAELVLLNERLLEEIKTRKATEAELEKSREDLRNLSEHLQQAREEERTRIAREVHDELSQSLSALQIDIARLQGALPEGALKTEAASAEDQVAGILDAARNICTELRPPGFDPSALGPAIEWHVARYEKRTGIRCTVRIGSGIRIEGRDLPLVVFRVFQEAMANVARHAEASAVYVGLMQNRRNIVLTVRDNGKGMTVEDVSKPGCFGIMGMRERIRFRGGRLRFASARGRGTTVTVSIPSYEGGEKTSRREEERPPDVAR